MKGQSNRLKSILGRLLANFLQKGLEFEIRAIQEASEWTKILSKSLVKIFSDENLFNVDTNGKNDLF